MLNNDRIPTRQHLSRKAYLLSMNDLVVSAFTFFFKLKPTPDLESQIKVLFYYKTSVLHKIPIESSVYVRLYRESPLPILELKKWSNRTFTFSVYQPF